MRGKENASTSIVYVDKNAMAVFPNPSASEFTLKVEKPDDVERIIVYDLMGKHIENIEHPFGKNSVTFGASLNPNIYVVQVYGADFAKSFRIVKR